MRPFSATTEVGPCGSGSEAQQFSLRNTRIPTERNPRRIPCSYEAILFVILGETRFSSNTKAKGKSDLFRLRYRQDHMGELRAFHNELLRLLSTFHVGCTPSSYPLALIGVPNPGSGLEGIRRKEAISPTHDAKSDCEARANGRSPDFESRYIRRWPCIISQTCQKKKKGNSG